jgi:hypothetical protein
MSDTVRDKMFEARDLIQAKRYAQARALLVTIDHPKASEWLHKLDDVEARERSMGTQVVQQRQQAAETQETRNPYARQQNAAHDPFMQPRAQDPYARDVYAQPPIHDPIRDDYAGGYDRQALVPAEPERKRINVLHVIGAVLGGIVGALIGAAIWAAVAYFTDYEIGYVAIAVGLLTGVFAVLFSGGRRGIPIQLIAVLTALLGIVVGKYAAFYMLGVKFLNEQAGRDITADLLREVSPFQIETIQGIAQEIVAAIQPIDALFVVLAVFAAIRIAAGARASQSLKPPDGEPRQTHQSSPGPYTAPSGFAGTR